MTTPATQAHHHPAPSTSPATPDHGATPQTSGRPLARPSAADLVPSRRQYLDLKRAHTDHLLLYRMGDFYEAFDDDATILSRDAGVVLTSRNFGRSGRVPMAGIPYHALNSYLRRLLAAGHSVAIAEQVGEIGKGLVERRVTRIVTRGTIGDADLLPEHENRYLAAIAPIGDGTGRIGLAWVDVSTGEFNTTEIVGADTADRLTAELARLAPSELLVPESPDFAFPPDTHRVTLPSRDFNLDVAQRELLRHFRTQTLAPLGCEGQPGALVAAGTIVSYIARTNASLLPLMTSLRTESLDRIVELDAATRRNLEITRSIKTGGTRGSLIGVITPPRTPMGARTLRRWLGRPLTDLAEIRRRQDIIAALVAQPGIRLDLSDHLALLGDVERLLGRITQGNAETTTMLTFAAALTTMATIAERLSNHDAEPLRELGAALDPCTDARQLLESAVERDPATERARIRPGFSPELDAAIADAAETRHWLTTLERHERERTGIRSLKVAYNKVFGYYIEVTRPNLDAVPADYIRKQTIATGERFVTAPLKEAEATLLSADETIAALERAALTRLTASITVQARRIQQTAAQLAELDALIALAETAARNAWCRPNLNDGDGLEIIGGRHPVVEAECGDTGYIPNDCHLGGPDQPRQLIVTGPNMGGKSTYLRSVALICLLAQVGSFVPAESATIGIVDRIFTRIGAHDDLAGGASTFMVEMVETATILRQATRQSLVILDEVGRGTSTADGRAIARAVLEDLSQRIGARALFATHYLEITSVAEHLPDVANVHVAVHEHNGQVIFLHVVRPGAADHAYGIHVARLAGLPPWVADHAALLLAAEQRHSAHAESDPADITHPQVAEAPASYDVRPNGPRQLPLAGFRSEPDLARRLACELRDLDLTTLSPKDALDWLFAQRDRLG